MRVWQCTKLEATLDHTIARNEGQGEEDGSCSPQLGSKQWIQSALFEKMWKSFTCTRWGCNTVTTSWLLIQLHRAQFLPVLGLHSLVRSWQNWTWLNPQHQGSTMWWHLHWVGRGRFGRVVDGRWDAAGRANTGGGAKAGVEVWESECDREEEGWEWLERREWGWEDGWGGVGFSCKMDALKHLFCLPGCATVG